MLGMACALAAGAAFLLAATLLKMPVSTTHTVVGAIIGMTMVGAGPRFFTSSSLSSALLPVFLAV